MQFINKVPVLVIAGGWNFHIFSPEWIGKYILPGKKLDVLYPVNNINASPKVTTEQVEIFVSENKLQMEPIVKDDESFVLVQELSLKLVDYLPHTPVTAFGINFSFDETITDDLEKLFLLSDSEKWKDKKASVGSFLSRREFQLNNGHKLNLTIRKQDEKIIFDFNFHFDIVDLVEFKSIIGDNSILDFKNNAIEIMTDLYNLNIEQ